MSKVNSLRKTQMKLKILSNSIVTTIVQYSWKYVGNDLNTDGKNGNKVFLLQKLQFNCDGIEVFYFSSIYK